MSNQLLDPLGIELLQEGPVEGDAPISESREGYDARHMQRSTLGVARQTAPARVETKSELGTHLTIGAVALFLLAMLGIFAIFSVPSTGFLTVDGLIALGIIVLSLGLSVLLGVANRREGM